MLVSVIIPTFNSDSCLDFTLESVLNQSHTDLEVIIIDGGSNDNTLSIVNQKMMFDNRIRLINNCNDNGPSHARLVGISNSYGSYIAFIDSDDFWEPNKIKLQLNFMIINKYKFSYTEYYLLNHRGAPYRIKNFYDYNSYLNSRGICNSSVLLCKSVLPSILFKNIYNGLAEDTYWWLQIMRSGVNAHGLMLPLTGYRSRKNSRSSDFVGNILAIHYIYKSIFKLNFFLTYKSIFLYVFDVFLRRFYRYIRVYFNDYK